MNHGASAKRVLSHVQGGLSVELTQRDIQVLDFVRDMKFGYAPVLHERFFSETCDTDRTVRNRLSEFKSAGLLTTAFRPNSREQLYLLTRQGERRLCQHLNEPTPIRPTLAYDPRLFDHDFKVQLARLALERSGRAKKWIAERRVKQTVTAFQGLQRKYMPDGLYENGLNELVAFEMEISPKSIQRYQEKIDKYVVLFRSHFNTPVRFSRALFICEHEQVFKRLTDMTRIHGDLFLVQRFKDLHSPLSSPVKKNEERA